MERGRKLIEEEVQRKISSHWKNSEMSTEDAHSRLLPLLFEMPPKRHYDWSVERSFIFNIRNLCQPDSRHKYEVRTNVCRKG